MAALGCRALLVMVPPSGLPCPSKHRLQGRFRQQASLALAATDLWDTVAVATLLDPTMLERA